MSLLASVKSLFEKDAVRSVHRAFDEGEPLAAGEHYLRIWLKEMYLATRQRWFTDLHPGLSASIRLKLGDREARELSRVLEPPRSVEGRAVLLDYDLTPLLPFRGGTVEIGTMLLALKGTAHGKLLLDVLAGFSSLVAAPVGQAIDVASQVNDGLSKVLGTDEDQVKLAYHRTLAGDGGTLSNVLRAGHLAVVAATAEEVDPARLSVVDGRLHYAERCGADAAPLAGYDYLLLHVEARRERDDWRELSTIDKPLTAAVAAYLRGKDDEGEAQRQNALIAVWESDDLTEADKRRVTQLVKERIRAVRTEGLGTAGVDLAAGASALEGMIDAYGLMSIDQARAAGPLAADEVFGDG